MTTECFVGIDIAKATFDYVVRAPGTHGQVANTPTGIAAFITLLTPLAPTLVVLEATGGLERALVAALCAAAIPVAVVNPRRARAFAIASGLLAKTDHVDAGSLAAFGACLHPQPYTLPAVAAQELAALVTRRAQLVAQHTAELNRLATALPVVQTSIREHLHWLTEARTAVETAIAARVAANTEWQALATLADSVPGIGPLTAALLVAELPELGHLATKQIAALVGLAPVIQDSGKKRGTRQIRGGRGAVRAMLYMPTLSAICHNPPLKAFYTRLRAAGKPFKVAMTACMHKLLTIVNAMIKHQTLWQAPAPGGPATPAPVV